MALSEDISYHFKYEDAAKGVALKYLMNDNGYITKSKFLFNFIIILLIALQIGGSCLLKAIRLVKIDADLSNIRFYY